MNKVGLSHTVRYHRNKVQLAKTKLIRQPQPLPRACKPSLACV